MAESGTIKIQRAEKWVFEYPPTRACLVCERLENPDATIVHTGLAWICPECKSRLRKLIYKEEEM